MINVNIDGVGFLGHGKSRDRPNETRRCHFVGLTVIECAGVLGCSEGTVKSNLHDARSKLRIALGEDTQ